MGYLKANAIYKRERGIWSPQDRGFRAWIWRRAMFLRCVSEAVESAVLAGRGFLATKNRVSGAQLDLLDVRVRPLLYRRCFRAVQGC
jgi:hypothetical protein